MRMMIVGVTILSCALAAPAAAQSREHDDSARSVTKIAIGAAALVVGATIAAKSSETTTVSSAVGTSQTSTFSTSQLVTGLAIAGVGGIILWDGARSHDRTRPSTRIGAGVGRAARSVYVQRSW